MKIVMIICLKKQQQIDRSNNKNDNIDTTAVNIADHNKNDNFDNDNNAK